MEAEIVATEHSSDSGVRNTDISASKSIQPIQDQIRGISRKQVAPQIRRTQEVFIKKLFTKVWAKGRETTRHNAELQISSSGPLLPL